MTGIWLQDPPTCGSEMGTSPGALVLSWSCSLGHLARAQDRPELSLAYPGMLAPAGTNNREEVGIDEEGWKEGELASSSWGSLFPAYQQAGIFLPHTSPSPLRGGKGEGASKEGGGQDLRSWAAQMGTEDARDQAADPGSPKGP